MAPSDMFTAISLSENQPNSTPRSIVKICQRLRRRCLYPRYCITVWGLEEARRHGVRDEVIA